MVDENLNEFEWELHGSCRGVAFQFPPDDSPFFQEGKGRGGTYPIARQYCAGCPVVVDCLISGVLRIDTVGFWGGTTDSERKLIRRLQRRGMAFKAAVEQVWREQRRKPNGANLAPPASVWKDWS